MNYYVINGLFFFDNEIAPSAKSSQLLDYQ